MVPLEPLGARVSRDAVTVIGVYGCTPAVVVIRPPSYRLAASIVGDKGVLVIGDDDPVVETPWGPVVYGEASPTYYDRLEKHRLHALEAKDYSAIAEYVSRQPEVLATAAGIGVVPPWYVVSVTDRDDPLSFLGLADTQSLLPAVNPAAFDALLLFKRDVANVAEEFIKTVIHEVMHISYETRKLVDGGVSANPAEELLSEGVASEVLRKLPRQVVDGVEEFLRKRLAMLEYLNPSLNVKGEPYSGRLVSYETVEVMLTDGRKVRARLPGVLEAEPVESIYESPVDFMQ